MNSLPPLAVFYCFPRSGGTLINQCLLCAEDNVVLSEVNPAGCVVPPVRQATDWFGLFPTEIDRPAETEPYLAQIRATARRCAATRRQLCVRDWSGINFLPRISAWAPAASGVLEQRLYLRHAGFAVAEARILRRSEAVYRSLRSKIEGCAALTVEAFHASYSAYLRATADAPTFHFEAFTREPRAELERLCRTLGLVVPADFEARFHAMTRVTGNTTLGTAPDSAGWKSIVRQREDPTGGMDHGPDTVFRGLDTLAGYPERSADE